MDITFPKNSAIDSMTMSVAFPVSINGHNKRILISREALEDHFGANENSDLIYVFESNRVIIEQKARELILNGYNQDNIILKTNMF